MKWDQTEYEDMVYSIHILVTEFIAKERYNLITEIVMDKSNSWSQSYCIY